ncbi:mucin-19-like [Chenopodium quinoa]|uniref:Uncharacterized protein n=1 Tax=Chenopodium quinoa TaxID=63459 RepID=A0A803M3R7_CHEQI|nr:mucin-19-like [Chenopodium quinoa]
MNRSFRGPETLMPSIRPRVPQLKSHHSSTTMREKEDDLALFLEMRKREKEKNDLMLLQDSGELDESLVSQPGSSPLFNIPSATAVRKTGPDEFLNSDGDKNDYDWLLTPPGTPLFPSLEMESRKAYMDDAEAPKAQPTALRSRLGNSQTETTGRSSLMPRQPNASSGLTSSASGIRRPSSSGGPGSRPPSSGGPGSRPPSSGGLGSRPVTPGGGSRPATPTGRPTVTSSKPSRSSTPTSRGTLSSSKPSLHSSSPKPSVSLTSARSTASVTSTKSAGPSRSSTPTRSTRTSAPSAGPSRSSTPTRPTARSSTPTRPTARSSTPTARPAVPTSRPTSRASTPTRRTSSSSVASVTASLNKSSSSISSKSVGSAPSRNTVPSRGTSPTVRSRPWNPSEMPGFSLDAPPNLRTTLPDRPLSAARGRPAAPAARSASMEPASNGRVGRRQSCSPSRGRAPNGGIHSSGSSVPAVNRGHSKVNEDVSPVVIGTKMVERVINMRKLAPPRQDDKHSPGLSGKSGSSPDSSGFGRSLSKKSLDMAIRHMDIRRTIPGNLRPLMTKIPASSMYSVRSGPTGSRTASVSDSPLATSSNASSELSVNNHAGHGSELEEDLISDRGGHASPTIHDR